MLLVTVFYFNANVFAIEPPSSITIPSSGGVDTPIPQDIIDAYKEHKCEEERRKAIEEARTKIAETIDSLPGIKRTPNHTRDHYWKLFLNAIGDEVKKACLEKE